MAENPDLHDAQSEITQAFTDHDMAQLATMTAEERAKQVAARWAVWRHIDKIWDAPHLRGNGQHPVEVGGYEGVAALRDLLMDLVVNVQNAQDAAEDDVDSHHVVVKVKHVDDLDDGDIDLDGDDD
jgi:hypothetical protein